VLRFGKCSHYVSDCCCVRLARDVSKTSGSSTAEDWRSARFAFACPMKARFIVRSSRAVKQRTPRSFSGDRVARWVRVNDKLYIGSHSYTLHRQQCRCAFTPQARRHVVPVGNMRPDFQATNACAIPRLGLNETNERPESKFDVSRAARGQKCIVLYRSSRDSATRFV
jgi:hypothetical protein